MSFENKKIKNFLKDLLKVLKKTQRIFLYKQR
jgi:hypothetical protein